MLVYSIALALTALSSSARAVGSGTCFESEGTEIPDCVCHSTCAKCGYNKYPTLAVDCIVCADPSVDVTAVFDGGTGACGPIVDDQWLSKGDDSYDDEEEDGDGEDAVAGPAILDKLRGAAGARVRSDEEGEEEGWRARRYRRNCKRYCRKKSYWRERRCRKSRCGLSEEMIVKLFYARGGYAALPGAELSEEQIVELFYATGGYALPDAEFFDLLTLVEEESVGVVSK